MSSTYGQRKDVSLRSYVSVNPFNTQLFSYTVSVNAQLQTVGTLAVVAGATALNCPVGRLLAETGKKIFPDVNAGVETPMVSVYDAVSGLTGFIDPNAAVFTVYSTDKPYFQQRGVDPVGDLKDNGMPIYTNGDIITKYGDVTVLGGNVNVNGNIDLSGTVTSTGGDVNVLDGHVNVDGNVNVTGNVDLSGTLTARYLHVSPFYDQATSGTVNAGSASVGTGVFNANTSVVVNTTACTSNSSTKHSLIFITGTGANTLRANITGANQFTVTSSGTDSQAFSWLVIN
uniref:Uncharacterized protein n=1 Tax=viral metagenome TaxID=1070528 RepID=A0A6C0BCI4_9ZZZZ